MGKRSERYSYSCAYCAHQKVPKLRGHRWWSDDATYCPCASLAKSSRVFFYCTCYFSCQAMWRPTLVPSQVSEHALQMRALWLLDRWYAHLFVSKTDSDKASRIFQHYSYPLAQAFGGTADELSTQFLGAGLISREKCEEVQLPQQTSVQKGNLLLAAIAARFDVDGGDNTLRKLCKIMSKHKHLKKLSTRILNKYGTSCWTLIVTEASLT